MLLVGEIMAKGEQLPISKLTEKDVVFIRLSKLPLGYLSALTGVTKVTIYRARVGEAWKHVKEEVAI